MLNFKIFDTLLDGVAIVNGDWQLIYANEAFSGICGVTTRRIREGVSLDRFLKTENNWQGGIGKLELLEGFAPYQEDLIITPEGSKKSVRLSVQTLAESETHGSTFLIYIRDLTEEQRLYDKYRAALRKKETSARVRSRRLVEAMLLLDLNEGQSDGAPKEMMVQILENVIKIFHLDGIAVFDFNKEAPFIDLGFWSHAKGRERDSVKQLVDWVAQEAVRLPQPIPEKIVNWYVSAVEEYVLTLAPLRLKSTPLGLLLMVQTREEYERTPLNRDTKILQTVAGQLASRLQLVRLHETSFTDDLTKLKNARFFHDRLTAEIGQTTESKGVFSLLMADIDHFKKVNDNYGHPTGDVVLRKVAEVIKAACRQSDFVCRYGGEEFAVILRSSDRADAMLIAERIRKSVEDLVWENLPRLKVTISLGVSEFPAHGTDKAALIESADDALYRAKNSGRNKVVAFTDEAEQKRDYDKPVTLRIVKAG